MVLIVTACPAGLRGDLCKWLTELTPGVFAGRPSARVRELIWERTVSLCKDGRALLVYSAANEQGMEFRTHRHQWEPTDFEGVTLMLRPSKEGSKGGNTRSTGWSNARRSRRQYRKRTS